MTFVAVAEVRDDVLRPLIGLGEEHPVRVAGVDLLADALQVLVRPRQVLAVRALVLEEVRHGVEPEAVEAEVEPEAQHLEHRVLDLRVLVIEVGLVVEEAVPVVLAAHGIPRPVRGLAVHEDDARVLVAVSRPTRRTNRPSAFRGCCVTPGTTDGRPTCGS